MRRWTKAVTLAGLLVCADALAEDEPTAQARRHFEAGRAAFRAGDLSTARREYEAAKALRPLPEFDYDLGLFYKSTGAAAAASLCFESYLEHNPRGEHRAEAKAAMAAQDRSGARGPWSPPFAQAPARPAEILDDSGRRLRTSGVVTLAVAVPINVVFLALGLASFNNNTLCSGDRNLALPMMTAAPAGILAGLGLLVGVTLGWVGESKIARARRLRLSLSPTTGLGGSASLDVSF